MSRELTDPVVFERPFDLDAGDEGEFENCRELLPRPPSGEVRAWVLHARVELWRSNDERQTARTNVEHQLVRHSPDGFEWGYGGSGPADLARSIVGDLLEQADPIPADYQRVKSALIATLPEKGGEIFADQVLDVLFGRLEDLL